MPEQKDGEKTTGRLSILREIKTLLGMFTFLVIVLEGSLGAAVIAASGQAQIVATWAMPIVLVLFLATFTYLGVARPEALFRTMESWATGAETRQKFCRRIEGHWWESITPDDSVAISFVNIQPDVGTGTVKLTGQAYDKDGNREAEWKSVSCCLSANEPKVFYYWTGKHPQRDESYDGFGEIHFRDAGKRIEYASGFFSATSLIDVTNTARKRVEMTRASEDDAKKYYDGKIAEMAELVRGKLTSKVLTPSG